MRVLGCDIGTTNIALAVVESDGGWLSELRQFKPELSAKELYQTAWDVLMPHAVLEEAFEPPHLFIESVFFGINSRTYARLVKVGFSLELAAAHLGISSRYMPTNQWKSMLFEGPRRPKKEVQVLAESRWPELSQFHKRERGHRSDALCIAQAGLVLMGRERDDGCTSGEVSTDNGHSAGQSGEH